MTYPEAMNRLASAEGVTQEMVDAIEDEVQRLTLTVETLSQQRLWAMEALEREREKAARYTPPLGNAMADEMPF